MIVSSEHHAVILNVLGEVDRERQYQVRKGYTREADGMKGVRDWVSLLHVRAHRALGTDVVHARRRLLQVAAIAVAAVEAIDSRWPEYRPGAEQR